MTTETFIAGTELKLTVRVEPDGMFSVQWDHLPTGFLFHEGFAAILRLGSGETEGMVELKRVSVETDISCAGHVEPLLNQCNQ